MIDNLTIMLHMFIVSLAIPANVSNFLSTLFPLITFDFLQIGTINEVVFKFEDYSDEGLTP